MSALALPLPINLRQVSRKLSLPGVCEVKIETEKTHIVTLTDSELNTLRVFLGEALGEGIWLTIPDDFPEDRKIIENLYQKSLKALGLS